MTPPAPPQGAKKMTPENPCAFPSPEVRSADGCGIYAPEYGMTLRDWFAGQALASRGHLLETGVRYASDLADECYYIADAMLAARSGPPPERPTA